MRVEPLRRPVVFTVKKGARAYMPRALEERADLDRLAPFESRNLPCPRCKSRWRVWRSDGEKCFCQRCGQAFTVTRVSLTITQDVLSRVAPREGAFVEAVEALL